MGIEKCSEVVDVVNDARKALFKFLRVHARVDDGHVPAWRCFDSTHNLCSFYCLFVGVGVGSHQRGRCWHQSVSPGTYPSGQRCCAASAPHSGRTKGATLVLARLGNATASLNLSVSPTRLRRYCCAVRRDARHTVRGQPRRKALRSYPAGQVRRKETHPHHPSVPPPPLRGRVAHQYEEYERSLLDE